jgi:hypothetical protein
MLLDTWRVEVLDVEVGRNEIVRDARKSEIK